ncbi:MAG TPA: choice-of-anchor L domain-containing protein [Telluria sp.]|nr:choice-of-anchor L domain-containing protein [Telluria sp.]
MQAFSPAAGAGTSTLASALLAPNSGISVVAGSVSVQASGPDAINFYDGSLTALGIGAGLLLTSGTTPGTSNTMPWFGTDNGGAGDADIDAVVNTVFQTQSYDATTLAFDFTVNDPAATSVSFDLVFGSDEFPEWVDQFVDSAVVMVNGVNYALFNHDPMHPLSVVSSNLAAGYFQDNASGFLPIEYDGVSHVLKIVAPINAGGVNHIKIGIADTGDHIYDSGVFLANFAAGTIPGSGVVSATPTGTDNADTCVGSAKDEYFDLKAGDDLAYAGAGDDIVVAGSGNDSVYGGSGADQLKGDAGDDLLDGGMDSDTAVYAGAKADYQIAFDAASGKFTVSSAAEGSDTLNGVEKAQFADGLYSLNGDGSVTLVPTVPLTPPSNQPGMVFLGGIAAPGQTLSATVADADGVPAAVTYQWQADGVDLGVSGASYTVAEGDVGKAITVSASYTDLGGHSEAATSAAKTILPPSNGDFTISMLQLAAPAGASVMNPLTTLMANALQLGATAGEAQMAIEQALGVPAGTDLLHDDPWAALQANPADAAALALEKTAVQVAVLTSLGSDDTGMALTQAILLAHSNGTTLDLADTTQIAALLGLDPANPLVKEIWDRNDTIGSANSVDAINAIWLDLQSGLDVVLSPSIATLNVHLNQAPVGSASAALADGAAGQAYTLFAADLLQGYSDPDGDALHVEALGADSGSLADNGDGSWTFTPDAGFSGPVELNYVVADGQGGSIGASQLFAIAAAANHAPTGSVVIAGTAAQGQTLNASATLADADGMGMPAYQWLADGVAIAGATGASLTLAEAQVGQAISVRASYVDGLGHAESVDSAATTPVLNVNDAPTGGLSIAGSAVVGQLLTATSTVADADGLGAFAWQWYANGAAIAGATGSSLLLQGAQASQAISVGVSYTDGHGTAEAVQSAATASVAAAPLTGTDASDSLTGTAAADQLFGLGGNDTLSGAAGDDLLDGGAGSDSMLGGAGNDRYVVDAATDKVIETTTATSKTDAGGTDTVEASVSWTLGNYVENLVLTGTAALNGSGNALANSLTGNGAANALSGLAGNDILDGGAGNDLLNGGAGSDALTGGSGADVFRFDSAPGVGVDTLVDFAGGVDSIQLENAVFKKLTAPGALSAANFRASADGTAGDANDYVLYNTSSGALLYDADGSGKGAAIQIATLVGHPDLAAADLIVT